MAKQKQETPINLNPNWKVSEEYTQGKDVLVPGDKVKVKFNRGEYKFIRHVYNTKTQTEWIDVVGGDGFRSFYVFDVKKVKPKKFRKKKNVN
jgi:hypothetical protein